MAARRVWAGSGAAPHEYGSTQPRPPPWGAPCSGASARAHSNSRRSCAREASGATSGAGAQRKTAAHLRHCAEPSASRTSTTAPHTTHRRQCWLRASERQRGEPPL
eukprot:3679668-Prymnesium_polylepis.1